MISNGRRKVVVTHGELSDVQSMSSPQGSFTFTPVKGTWVHQWRSDQDVELLLPGSSWRVIAKSVCQYTSVCIASIGSCLTSESILKVERTQCGDSGVLFD